MYKGKIINDIYKRNIGKKSSNTYVYKKAMINVTQ